MKFVKSAMISSLKTSSLASVFLASSLAIGLSTPLATMAQADIIQERKANFKQSAGALRAMRTQMSQGDYAAIAKSADAIAAWAEKCHLISQKIVRLATQMLDQRFGRNLTNSLH